MKRTIMTSALFFLFIAISFSQGPDLYVDISQLMKKNEIGVQFKVDMLTTLEGSPYVYDEFQQGRIHTVDSDIWFAIEVNKNAYTNHFEFKYEGDIYEMPNYIFDSLFINISLYVPVSIKVDNAMEIYSMEVLRSDGNGNMLLKNEVVKFMDRIDAKPFIEATPARYKKFPPTYYLATKDAEPIQINNLNDLCAEDFAPRDLQTFIRKNKIKKRDESDLKKLFGYMFVASE